VARSCIFCGTSPTTNAHVFRKAWLDSIYPAAGDFEHTYGRGDEFDRKWSKGEADVKVNCVCNTCNSGWMNRLDHQAEDLFLDAAVRGYPVKLERMADKTILARWCLLVAVLCDHIQAVPIVPAGVHRAVFEGGVAEGVRMWTFRTEPPQGDIAVSVQNRTMNLRPASGEAGDAYFVTFCVHHFVAQAFVPTERTPKGIAFERGPNTPIVRELWPAPLTPLFWPPPQTIPWDQMADLADAFQS